MSATPTANLTIENSYFRDAVTGHEIKGRAATTIIQNSRKFDRSIGTAAYSVDPPNGGNAIQSNSVIEQGPKSQNPAIIHFGGEGTPYAGPALTISDNAILNDFSIGISRALLKQRPRRVELRRQGLWSPPSGQIAI